MKCLAVIAAICLFCVAHSQILAGTADPSDSSDSADLDMASRYVKQAWNDFTHCRRPSACNQYFESFGVAIAFADGSIAPFSHTQRLKATSRDCIKMARTYLERGDRSLALQWAMAARIEDVQVRNWLGNHPDAVLEALRHCCW